MQSAGSAASRGANENEGGSRYVIQHLTRHKCVFRHQHHRPTKALAHFGHFALCNKFLLSLASLIHLVISMYYLLQRAIRLEIYDILQVWNSKFAHRIIATWKRKIDLSVQKWDDNWWSVNWKQMLKYYSIWNLNLIYAI